MENKPKKLKISENEEINVIQSSINLNTSQADIIEMIIENKLEVIKNQLNDKKAEILLLKEKRQNIIQTICDGAAVDVINSKQYKDFIKSCDIFNIIPTIKCVQSDCSYDIKIESKQYPTSNFEMAEESKQPFNHFENRTNINSVETFSAISTVLFELIAGSGDVTLKLRTHIKITELNDQVKQMKPVITKIASLKQELYHLQFEYLRIKCSTKFIKAQLTKSFLSKTKEGLQLIDFLEKATLVKALK